MSEQITLTEFLDRRIDLHKKALAAAQAQSKEAHERADAIDGQIKALAGALQELELIRAAGAAAPEAGEQKEA